MGLLAVLQLITSIATEANVAVPAVFGLIKGVRDNWTDDDPNAPPPPTDDALVAMMRQQFGDNSVRNAELQAEIEAGNLPEPPAEG